MTYNDAVEAMSELRTLLGRLSDAFGPSGNEKAVRELVRAEIESSVDSLAGGRDGQPDRVQGGRGAGAGRA